MIHAMPVLSTGRILILTSSLVRDGLEKVRRANLGGADGPAGALGQRDEQIPEPKKSDA